VQVLLYRKLSPEGAFERQLESVIPGIPGYRCEWVESAALVKINECDMTFSTIPE
jgi:hypothetical protein